MSQEIWKSTGHINGYEVSDLGRVRNKDGKILCQCLTKKGYLRVQLYKNNKKRAVFVHRLVAKAFISNPDSLPQVNHKNTIKTDNRVINLEWCTNEYNSKHAFDNGLIKGFVGSNHPLTTLTEAMALEIRQAKIGKDAIFKKRIDLAIKYGVSESCIKDIRSNRSWTHI